jgi:hypothetical protein
MIEKFFLLLRDCAYRLPLTAENGNDAKNGW